MTEITAKICVHTCLYVCVFVALFKIVIPPNICTVCSCLHVILPAAAAAPHLHGHTHTLHAGLSKGLRPAR